MFRCGTTNKSPNKTNHWQPVFQTFLIRLGDSSPHERKEKVKSDVTIAAPVTSTLDRGAWLSHQKHSTLFAHSCQDLTLQVKPLSEQTLAMNRMHKPRHRVDCLIEKECISSFSLILLSFFDTFPFEVRQASLHPGITESASGATN